MKLYHWRNCIYSCKISVSNVEIYTAYMSDSPGNAYNKYTSCWKSGRIYDLACYGFRDNNINVYKNYTPVSLNIVVMYTQSIHHRVDEGV